MGSPHWSATETQSLAALYPDTSNAVLSRVFNRPARAIGLKARSMGLKKSAKFMAEESGRIKPGQSPWNKGVKGSTGTQDACRATQFKPGRAPSEARNYKPVGSLRISKDGYLEKKVTDDQSIYPARRWVALHRLVWERKNGQVPKGHIVVFRPGMLATEPDQITVDRLECITRSENMQRNTYHRYGKEIAQLIQLRGAITRKIREKEKEKELEHEHQ